MDEQIELPAEDLPHLEDDSCDVVVRADVTAGDERGVDGTRQRANACLDPFPLVGAREVGPALCEARGDHLCNRTLGGDGEDEAALACESSHGGRVYGF